MNEYEEKQERRRERYSNMAKNAEIESTNLFNRAGKMASAIPFGQPILVGHHSENRDRSYRNKMGRLSDRGLEAYKKSEYYARKAESVGKGGISSDDPEAIEKLTKKLQDRQDLQKRMKEVNKAVRKKDKDKLSELGYTEEQITEFFTPNCFGMLGFAPYQLQNNNAEIRRLTNRIKKLTENKNTSPKDIEKENYIYKEKDNRCQFIFDEKPDEEVRMILKSKSFRWSPSRGAWVRKLTANAQYYSKIVIQELDELFK